MKIYIIFFILVFSSEQFAQNDELSVVLKAGRASFMDADLAGSIYDIWNIGPQISLGIEKKLNKTFSLQEIITYSIHKYNGFQTFYEPTNDAKIRILELMCNIKLNIGIFYLISGVGISNQNGDEVRYLENTKYHSAIKVIDGKNKTRVAGILGLGFDIHIYQEFNLIAEGELNIREYMGSVWLLGIKYTL